MSLFLGDPSGYVEPVHEVGGLVLCTVGSAEEARRAVASGVDVIVAQGWEAGGHVGGSDHDFALGARRGGRSGPGAGDRGRGIGTTGVAAVLALGAQAAVGGYPEQRR